MYLVYLWHPSPLSYPFPLSTTCSSYRKWQTKVTDKSKLLFSGFLWIKKFSALWALLKTNRQKHSPNIIVWTFFQLYKRMHCVLQYTIWIVIKRRCLQDNIYVDVSVAVKCQDQRIIQAVYICDEVTYTIQAKFIAILWVNNQSLGKLIFLSTKFQKTDACLHLHKRIQQN